MLARPVGLDLSSNVFVEMSEPLVRHMFDTHDQLLLYSLPHRGFPFALARPFEHSLVGFLCASWTCCQRGGLSSLASQPTASVFSGSMAMETFSMRWQVRHSKVRSSKPRLPGEIRANPILCLQVGHIGRSTL